MKGFNFEKDLNHQSEAVNSTIAVFENLENIKQEGVNNNCINPKINYQNGFQYIDNIIRVQGLNSIGETYQTHNTRNGKSNIIDIMMETGTGKTYTYTKTIFELNKNFGIYKFVVVVPTLSIKAGTVDFLKSESSREHFKEQYGKSINLHIVESKKLKKNSKFSMPPAVVSFVTSGDYDRHNIQVMIINAGMLNSPTMEKQMDRGLLDKFTVPFDGIAATRPFVIVDEPHKFSQSNKTWENIQKLNPQFILRYGATFQEYENLIYTLSAVESFNRNLVKGVIGHITEFESGKNAIVKFVSSNGTEATFELTENSKKKTFKLIKKSSLKIVHHEMNDLFIENISKTSVVLSNGLTLKKGDKFNPYSYALTLQEIMIRKAVKHHFEIEKDLLTREVKIKPITLFFIDNIEEYRGDDGYIKSILENLISAEIKNILKYETNEFYKKYLEKTLDDLSKTHAGYFSKDNSDKDENIEQEVNEILHDKQAMLDLNNPRRFIFSKWTLREGWDNPNVFQICKLRSSGSEISKLQEVGRGLRLPVNEYGNRVKDEQFYLNYFVDFTENDFVDKLVNEINEKSGALSSDKEQEKLNDDLVKKICNAYKMSEDELFDILDENNVVTRTNKFKEGGWQYIKSNFALAFNDVSPNKIRKSTDTSKKIKIRTEKYQELKELWEKINEKVILEYKFDSESEFQSLLTEFFKTLEEKFRVSGVKSKKSVLEIKAIKWLQQMKSQY
jgi:type III restriction enzyme